MFWTLSRIGQEWGWLSRYSDGLQVRHHGFNSGQCKIFLFSTVSRPILGPTQPPIQWAPGALSPTGKKAGPWSWSLTTFSAEVKKVGAMPPLLHTYSWHSA
jgi:hypothetical protein